MRAKTRPSLAQILCLAAAISIGPFLPAAHAQAPADLDRDGIPNITDRDVDNDGILNSADRNIDGGTARSGPLRGRVIGDNLPNNSPQELDMDADGLADDAVAETDIDGDGSANGLDADMDGDGVANISDADMDGTSLEDATLDILYEVPGNPRAYANDAAAASIISFVSTEVRKALQIPTTDTGLRVRVQINGGTVDQPAEWGGRITGVWRYYTSDRIQLWAKWCYPANDPSQLKIFVNYSYVGPYRGNPMDFSNPANYAVSEENRLHAGYSTTPGEFSLTRIASSPNVFIYWLPGQPVEFFYSAPNAQATGFAPPYDALRAALGGYPNFTSNVAYLDFSADLSTAANFQGVQPILGLLRTIRQVNLNWYGQLENRQIQ